MVPGNASVLMGEVSASVQLVSTLPVARMLSIRGQPLASTLDVVVLRKSNSRRNGRLPSCTVESGV